MQSCFRCMFNCLLELVLIFSYELPKLTLLETNPVCSIYARRRWHCYAASRSVNDSKLEHMISGEVKTRRGTAGKWVTGGQTFQITRLGKGIGVCKCRVLSQNKGCSLTYFLVQYLAILGDDSCGVTYSAAMYENNNCHNNTWHRVCLVINHTTTQAGGWNTTERK